MAAVIDIEMEHLADAPDRISYTSRLVFGKVTFTGTYTTNGEAISLSNLGLVVLHSILFVPRGANGFVPSWNGDKVAPKVQLLWGNYDAVDGVLIEVPNGTNHTAAVVGFQALGA